jgi:transaldolase
VAFAKDILKEIPDKPISFEVFSDEFPEMERQARLIASWGKNVYVKIPVTNTRGQSSVALLGALTAAGVRLNVTAMLTFEQVRGVVPALAGGPGAFVSLFAGRVADAGVDPVPIMRRAVEHLKGYPGIELIWASCREVFNVIQAEQIGCHIITVTNDVIRKLGLVGKDLTEYSLDTVKTFYEDAKQAGYAL